MVAQSGHEQRREMSCGAGNSPVPLRVTTAITPREIDPCSSSTIESILPAHCDLIAAHLLRASGLTSISTSYRLEPLTMYLEGPRKYGTPEFWGLFEDNDKSKRLLAIANAGADVGDLWEWAAEGWYPVDPTSEAFRIGVNYFIYAVTH